MGIPGGVSSKSRPLASAAQIKLESDHLSAADAHRAVAVIDHTQHGPPPFGKLPAEAQSFQVLAFFVADFAFEEQLLADLAQWLVLWRQHREVAHISRA